MMPQVHKETEVTEQMGFYNKNRNQNKVTHGRCEPKLWEDLHHHKYHNKLRHNHRHHRSGYQGVRLCACLFLRTDQPNGVQSRLISLRAFEVTDSCFRLMLTHENK